MGMANGGRGPGREWATLAIASLGAFIACLIVRPGRTGPRPWYLTVAMATAAAVFLVAAAAWLAQPVLRRRRSASTTSRRV